MTASLLITEAMNLFSGDDGPNNSKHLNLASCMLPDLEEMKQEHHAGGSIGSIEVGGLGIKALMLKFKLNGYDPQTMTQFGLGSQTSRPYTLYGAVRDKATQKLTEVKAICWGRLGKVTLSEMKRGDLSGMDHEITEIIRYGLWYDKAEQYYYDWASAEYRVGGVSQVADVNAILRIPTGA